ncbi:MAG: hypothetical protein BGO49_04495 [Planctomycetales bacterium 71-10]|mgnify:CR=1 FL=1|nr:MAG: hypothetical protein BGO49_04495 [Planctomycetales bacterium 71-10]
MAIKRRDLIQTFKAKDESGREYTLQVYVDIIDAFTTADPNGEMPGVKSIFTADRDRVRRKGKGVYEIVGHRTIRLTSDDPNAP